MAILSNKTKKRNSQLSPPKLEDSHFSCILSRNKSSYHLGLTESLRYKVYALLRYFYKHPVIYIVIGAPVAPTCSKHDLDIINPGFCLSSCYSWMTVYWFKREFMSRWGESQASAFFLVANFKMCKYQCETDRCINSHSYSLMTLINTAGST